MSSTTDRIRARFQRLIVKGHELLRAEQRSAGINFVSPGDYSSWYVQSEAALVDSFGGASIYLKSFKAYPQGNRSAHLEPQLGVLIGVAEAIEHGELESLASLVVANVFAELMEMAEHLHQNNYYVPAASLCGAVLEDTLRRLCGAHSLTYSKRDGIDTLNKKLLAGEVYEAFEHSLIDAWRHLRNDADHGHFDKVTSEKVSTMLEGVRRLMTQHAQELGGGV